MLIKFRIRQILKQIEMFELFDLFWIVIYNLSHAEI